MSRIETFECRSCAGTERAGSCIQCGGSGVIERSIWGSDDRRKHMRRVGAAGLGKTVSLETRERMRAAHLKTPTLPAMVYWKCERNGTISKYVMTQINGGVQHWLCSCGGEFRATGRPSETFSRYDGREHVCDKCAQMAETSMGLAYPTAFSGDPSRFPALYTRTPPTCLGDVNGQSLAGRK